MYPLILILIALLQATVGAPALLPYHRLLFDSTTKRIEYNSTYSEVESSEPQKWILKPDIGHPVLFRVILHEVIFPGNGQDCLSTAYIILTDDSNNSAIYCGIVKNRELRMLSLQLNIQIVVASKFGGNIFANISYEFVDPSEQQILPVCGGITGNFEMLWSCKPYFHAPTFSETVCIRSAEICDGHNQCPNGEDEESNVCNVVNITSLHVSWCKSGTCFPCRGNASKICNGFSDRQDGNDESGRKDGLMRNASCPNQTFYCQEEAKCLPLSDVCNGLQECIELSDESTSACEWRKNHSDSFVNVTFIWSDTSTSCPLEYPFFCPGDNTCLTSGAICNGLTDCSDGFDESAIVCKVVSGYGEESNNQTAPNYSTVLMEPTDVDIITTNRTLDGLKETVINYNKTDSSSFREVIEVEGNGTKELWNSPENVKEVAADIFIEAGNSSNDHSTTVADAEYAEMASNCTHEGPKSDQEKPGDDYSNATTSEATITTVLEKKEFIDVNKYTEFLKTTLSSGGSLTTEGFSSSANNSSKKEDETNEAKESSRQTVTAYSMAEESTTKTTETYVDTEKSQPIAEDSELNLNSHSVIEEQSTPFSETPNGNRTAKTEKLALVPPLEFISDLSINEQENNESTMESLAESDNNTDSNDTSHSPEVDLRANYSSIVSTEPPVKLLEEPVENPHTTESTLAETTSVPCSPLCKTNNSEAESFNKSEIGFAYHSHDFTDGLTLKKADIKSIMARGSETEGEIAFPPLWIARVSSGSFFLCYGVLLADGSPSRWVLIPASCGRYLQPSAMLVHFGAGIDNYE